MYFDVVIMVVTSSNFYTLHRSCECSSGSVALSAANPLGPSQAWLELEPQLAH